MTTIEISELEIEIYRAADTALRTARETWREEEMKLMAARNAALRRLVGKQRGRMTRAARVLGVSDAQLFRLLDEGISRTVRSALDDAEVDRSDYRLIHQRGSRSIGVVLTDPGLSEELVTQVLAAAGLSMIDRRPISLVSPRAMGVELRRVKRIAQDAMNMAQISSSMYRLKEDTDHQVVRLTLTEIMEGVKNSVKSYFLDILRSSGLDVEDDSEVILLRTPDKDDEPVEEELLFSWTDND